MSSEEKIQTRKMLIQPGVDPNVGVDGRKIVEVLKKAFGSRKSKYLLLRLTQGPQYGS